jgi:hypothetical protein
MLPFALGLVSCRERPSVHTGVLSISVVLQSFRRPLRTREKTRSHREHGLSVISNFLLSSRESNGCISSLVEAMIQETIPSRCTRVGTCRPVTQRRCKRTASLRATATIARFFAFLPPRSAIRAPQRFRSVSGPKRPNKYCADWTGSDRRRRLPALLILSC